MVAVEWRRRPRTREVTTLFQPLRGEKEHQPQDRDQRSDHKPDHNLPPTARVSR